MNEESQTNPELDDFIDDVLSGAAENAEDDVNVGDEVQDSGEVAEESALGGEEIQALIAERDSHLETSRRIQAEFENYRKQVAKRESDSKVRAAQSLVSEILPTLDACDAAITNGAEDVDPIRSTLFSSLEKLGLERAGEVGDRFDPELHDAVSQGGESDGDGPQITEVMRAGYVWKGKTLRPAMVQVSS